MKYTYIFTVANGLTEDDLCRLAQSVRMRTISYRLSHSHHLYDSVQVFTVPGEMHRIAHAAGFSGEQLRVALPAARRRGDTAVARSNQRLADARANLKRVQARSRRESEVSWVDDKQFLKNLRRMVRVSAALQMPGGTKRSKRSA